MTKLPGRRKPRPVTKPQFKERMVLPMVFGKPVVPGVDLPIVNPEPTS